MNEEALLYDFKEFGLQSSNIDEYSLSMQPEDEDDESAFGALLNDSISKQADAQESRNMPKPKTTGQMQMAI